MGGSALILGDGIAGLLAASVLRRAGWDARVAGRGKGTLPHHRHAHAVSETIVGTIEALCGDHLPGWEMADAIAITDSGWRDETRRPLLDPAGFAAALRWQATRLGARFGGEPAIVADGDVWRWDDGAGHGGPADLLIDASGAGAAVGRIAGVDLAMEELDTVDRCWTWHGTSAGPGCAWTIAARAILASDALLVRRNDGGFRMTVRSASAAPPDPRLLLDAILVAVGGAWQSKMGAIRLDPVAIRHQAPFARRTLVGNRESLPPTIRLGDALIQTAPRFGQGIAQIARHAELLASGLSESRGLWEIATAIKEEAAQRWTAMVIAAAAYDREWHDDERTVERVAVAAGAGCRRGA